jgi:hypothetical protein
MIINFIDGMGDCLKIMGIMVIQITILFKLLDKMFGTSPSCTNTRGNDVRVHLFAGLDLKRARTLTQMATMRVVVDWERRRR